MTFLCAHWSFMWFYDDILNKAIRHIAGTSIKNIPIPRGVIKGRKPRIGRMGQHIKNAGLLRRVEHLRKKT